MNIKEVAAYARLSTATVSRAINQSGLVRPRTAEKVWRAVRDLGYYPNTQARTLVSGRSRMFGLIISDIVNPFFPELVKSFEFAAVIIPRTPSAKIFFAVKQRNDCHRPAQRNQHAPWCQPTKKPTE